MKRTISNLVLSGIATAVLVGGGAATAFANDSVGAGVVGGVGVRADVGDSVHANISGTARVEARDQAEVNVASKAKERAHMEIDRRVDLLGKLSDRIEGATRISGSDKASLSASLQAQIDALVALKAKIDAESATTSLKADIESITKSYRIFAFVAPKAAITAYADRLKVLGDQMTTLGTKLQARITAASSTGADVSAAVAAKKDYDTQVANAQAQVTAAANAVAALQADNGDATVAASNKAALKDARAKLDAARKSFETARKDVSVVLKALPKVEASSHTTASSSVE